MDLALGIAVTLVSFFFPGVAFICVVNFFVLRTNVTGTSEQSIGSVIACVGTLVGASVFIVRKRSKMYTLRWCFTDTCMLTFCVLLTVASMWTPWPLYSFTDLGQVLILVLPWYVLGRAFSSLFELEAQLRLFRQINMAGCVFAALFAALGFVTGATNTGGQVSLSETPNIVLGYSAAYGALASLSMIMSNRKGKLFVRPISLFFLAVSAWLLVSVEKRGSLVSLGVGLLAMAVAVSYGGKGFRFQRIMVYATAWAMAFFVANSSFIDRFSTALSGNEESANERVEFQQIAYQRFENNPLFGIGLGHPGIYPHNIFYESASSGGIFALAVMIMMHWVSISSFIRKLREDSMVEYSLAIIPTVAVGFLEPQFSFGLTMHRLLPFAFGILAPAVNRRLKDIELERSSPDLASREPALVGG